MEEVEKEEEEFIPELPAVIGEERKNRLLSRNAGAERQRAMRLSVALSR